MPVTLNDLHPVQKKILEILKRNIAEPITIRQLQEDIGLSSPSVVQHHIFQLEKKGFLRRNPSNPRDYQVLADSPEKRVAFINLYGMAQCGPGGSMLDGNPIDRIPVATKLLGFPASQAFLVKARGTSMMPKINPGDLVIAKKSTDALNDSIVVCSNNGEVLIKKIQKIQRESGEIIYNLISLNDKDFPPFIASGDFRIEGLVRGILSYSI
jgi:repressor LexA